MSDNATYQASGMDSVNTKAFSPYSEGRTDNICMARYPTGSSGPTLLHAFSIHFIQNLFYFVQFG